MPRRFFVVSRANLRAVLWGCAVATFGIAALAAGSSFVSQFAAAAHAPSRGQTPPQTAQTAPAAGAAQPGKAKQNIAQLKKLKLIETLDLNEQLAEKFFVRYNAEQKKVDEATKDLNESMKQLEQALQKKLPPDRLKQLSDETLDKRAQLYSLITERYRALRSVLDERQYAKFLVFEQRFQEQLRRAILDVKRDNKKTEEAQKK